MTYILYHKNCDDGFGAAWVADRWLGNVTHKPVQYGDGFPEIPDDEQVFILDFSFPRDILIEQSRRLRITLLDHHKTAEEDLKGLDFAVFDMERSGAMMTWDWFYQGVEPPLLISYVQDRDLWTLELPHTESVTAYIRSWPRLPSRWDDMAVELGENFDQVVAEGSSIRRATKQQIDRAISQATMQNVGGHEVMCVNETHNYSEVAGGLAELFPECPFGAAYYIRSDGLKVYSLMGRGDFDVSAVAKANGGGGHHNAAGFQEALV